MSKAATAPKGAVRIDAKKLDSFLPDTPGETPDKLFLKPELRNALSAAGLEVRFINKKGFREHGAHQSGWIPLRKEMISQVCEGYDPSRDDLFFGVGADGFIQRGLDLILAIRKKSYGDIHRARLNERKAAYKDVEKLAKESIGKRSHGAKVSILSDKDHDSSENDD